MGVNSLGKCTIAIGLLLTPLGVVTCQVRPTMIRGVVTDESVTPISNAFIELSCPSRTKVIRPVATNSGTDGHFQLEAILRGACKAKITAPGFAIRVIPVSGSGKDGVIDLGKIQLSVSLDCSVPDVMCDEVTPN